MQATDTLMEEHRVIERVLTSLEQAARRLERGEQVRPGFFIDAADFIKGFADGCHHKKEEGVLFVAMVDAGLPRQVGPIAVMLSEHEQGRVYTHGMREAALRLQAGDASARGEVVQNALGYVALLRQHIEKENGVLFPMANEMIPVARQDAVYEGFEHVEHEETGEGVHEKYLALAESLEREASGQLA
jgi:hemerythrin-like domain-containing protein